MLYGHFYSSPFNDCIGDVCFCILWCHITIFMVFKSIKHKTDRIRIILNANMEEEFYVTCINVQEGSGFMPGLKPQTYNTSIVEIVET